jgi:hypothetical protein
MVSTRPGAINTNIAPRILEKMTKKGKKGVGDHGGGRGGVGIDEGREKLTEVDKEWFQIQVGLLLIFQFLFT